MLTYCHGVARLVFLQSLERPGNKRVELEELLMITVPKPDVTDVRRECLNHCLRRLPAENREPIIEYYRKDGRQKIDHQVSIAERLGIPLNALRSRAQSIRDKLERCVMRRLKDHNLRPALKAELEQLRRRRQAAAPTILSFLLAPAPVRGEKAPPQSTIPLSTGKARLLMELGDNDYANYQAVFQTIERREILRRRTGKVRFGNKEIL